jgi:hypothetical protein
MPRSLVEMDPTKMSTSKIIWMSEVATLRGRLIAQVLSTLPVVTCSVWLGLVRWSPAYHSVSYLLHER